MKTVSATELAKTLDMSLNGAVKRIENAGVRPILIDGKGRGGKVRAYRVAGLPAEIRAQVEACRRALPATEDRPVEWSELPQWKIDSATNRFELLTLLDIELKDPANWDRPQGAIIEAFVSRYNRGKISKDLLARLGQRDPRTVKRWIAAYNACKQPDRRTALIPQYGKRLGQTKVKPEELQVINNLYLTGNIDGKKDAIGQNKLPVKGVYMLYSSMAEANGLTSVSYATFWRYISMIPHITRLNYRSGNKEFSDTCIPSAIRGYRDILPDDWWCSDGHTLNLFCYDKDERKIIRPVVVAWMDLGSRKPMSWEIGESETKESVIGSLANGIRNNGYVYPLNLLLDNGKAYKNKQTTGRSRKRHYLYLTESDERDLRGAFARIGPTAHFTDPYNAKSKPIERFWQVVNDYVSRTFVGYTGRNVVEKPEYLAELMKRAKNDPSVLPTLNEVREKFAEFVAWYCDRPHTGEGMDGRTPNEVHAQGMEELRTIDESALAFACLHRYEAVVQRHGVKRYGRWYRDADQKLLLYLTERVEIAVNPEDLSSVEIYTLDGKHICRAEAVEYASMNAESRAESEGEIRRLQRDRMKVRKLAEQGAVIKGRRDLIEHTIEAEAAREFPQLTGTQYADELKNLKRLGE